MKIVNLQCPNCGARLTVENDMYVCNSCGTSIAIDYDESDVEYERAKNEVELEEKRQAHEKELLERKYELEQKAQIESEKRQIKRERQKAFSASAKKTMSSLIALLFVVGQHRCLLPKRKDGRPYVFISRCSLRAGGRGSDRHPQSGIYRIASRSGTRHGQRRHFGRHGHHV